MNKTDGIETGERIISFERAETNHDKVAKTTVTLLIICINFGFVLFFCFFADNLRECATLNAVYKETFKLHIFIESR